MLVMCGLISTLNCSTVKKNSPEGVLLLLRLPHLPTIDPPCLVFDMIISRKQPELLRTVLKLFPLLQSKCYEALKQTARIGDAKTAEVLLSYVHTDVSSILCKACESGHVSFIKVLLKHPLVDPQTKFHRPLFKVVQRNHPKALQVLIEDGRIDLTIGKQYPFIDPPPATLSLLLKHDMINPTGTFDSALRGNLHDSVSVLLKHGVDPSGNNQRALWHYVSLGREDIVKMLLADTRVDPSLHEQLPLRIAVNKESLSMTKLLLQHPKTMPTEKLVLDVKERGLLEMSDILEERLRSICIDTHQQ